MSDVSISYKNNVIATMDASGSKVLGTKGKYCEDDIEIDYVKPESGGSSGIVLLASGSFTKTSESGQNMYIPVEYSGTPYFFYVVADEILADTAQSYCFIGLNTTFPGAEYLQNGKGGITSGVNASGSIATNAANGNNNIGAEGINCNRASNNYLIQNNKYNWFIYGEAAS